MSWIILILAGLMEVGFTFCLSKTKTASEQELIGCWLGFLGALALSMFLMAKASQKIPIGVQFIPFGPVSERSEPFLSEFYFSMNLLLFGEFSSLQH